MFEVVVHLLDHFSPFIDVLAIHVVEKDHAFLNLFVIVFSLPILNLHEIVSGLGADHVYPLVHKGDFFCYKYLLNENK